MVMSREQGIKGCGSCPHWYTYIQEGWAYCKLAANSRMCPLYGKLDFLKPGLYSTPEIEAAIFEDAYQSWKHLAYQNPNCMPGGVNYDYSYLVFQNRFENELFLKNFGIMPKEPEPRGCLAGGNAAWKEG
jgi:hypothetical protein